MPNRINWTAPINWSDSLNRGLRQWHLAAPGNMAGTKFFDLVRRNHGTMTNLPTSKWTAGTHQGGFGAVNYGTSDFDQYIDVTGYLPVPPYTVSCWVLITDKSTQGHSFFCRADLSVTGKREMLVCDSANSYKFAAITDGTSGSFVSGINAALSLVVPDTYRWYNVVGVWPSSSVRSLYVDGVFQSTATREESLNNNDVDRAWYGRLADSTPNWEHRGLTDDCRIWDRALNAAEIKAVYNDSLAGYPRTLRQVARPYFVPEDAPVGSEPNLLTLLGVG